MAGRFVIQKLASGISRSGAFLVEHGPSARAAAPAAGTPPVDGTVLAARYFSRTSMPSAIVNPAKPACVDSFGGAKEPLSSMVSTRQIISMSREEIMAAWVSEMDAISAARQAQYAALQAERKASPCFLVLLALVCFGPCLKGRSVEEVSARARAVHMFADVAATTNMGFQISSKETRRSCVL